jgi:UDPglucose--hexose-1-phosphate uridylyltransferase
MHGAINEFPHRRYNPLTGDWILVSPHRMARPWDGQIEQPDQELPPAFLESCYLCPGNLRAGGSRNPDYQQTFIFNNDFPALLATSESRIVEDPDELIIAAPETGVCRVICYAPRHDLTIARMSPDRVVPIIDAWIDEYRSLGSEPHIGYVQIFENRGSIMGCSNPHPHGQIWATGTIPSLVATELDHQQRYLQQHGSCLLCTYLAKELEHGVRVLSQNSSFVALVPYWAVWPFETMIIPRRHQGSIESMDDQQKDDLASILVELGICYDNLFMTSFPYSMGIHQKPTDGGDYPFCHYHFHYLPPLLRSRSVKKHMVGYEMLAAAQRDLTAEAAADRLREVSGIHYLDKGQQP